MILDATLREGEQTPGVYFDEHIKLAIADLLNEIGIRIIEAGHPMVTPEIYHAVKRIANPTPHSKARSTSFSRDRECAPTIDFSLRLAIRFTAWYISGVTIG
ncbi:MAG: hypothetical protein P8Y99_16135 [Calditrichaceae bacterium]